MSTFNERKRLAEAIAQETVFNRLPQPTEHLHVGALHGLSVAAYIVGMTAEKQASITLAAIEWSDANCPARATKPTSRCQARCPAPCRHIPLAPRHWR